MEQIFGKGKKVYILKCVLSLLCVLFVFCGMFHTKLDEYYKYNNIVKGNQNTDNATELVITEKETIRQKFIAEGNWLISTGIYIETEKENREGELLVSLLDENGTVFKQVITRFSDISSKEFNKIDFNVSLVQGETYFVEVALQNTNQQVLVLLAPKPEGEAENPCTINGKSADGILVQQLYLSEKSIGLVNGYEIFYSVVSFILLTVVLCFGICKFEVLFQERKKEEYIRLVPAAVFFALLLVMKFNPLSEYGTEVKEFKRIIGEGIINNYDCSQVTTNFTLWFGMFVVLFLCILSGGLYLYAKDWNEEEKKAFKWLGKMLPLGYVSIGFQVISFFAETDKNVFHFSFSVLTILIICSLVFILGKFGRKISFEHNKQIIFMFFLWSFPVGVLLGEYWENGRILLDIFFSMNVVFWIFLMGAKRYLICSPVETILQVLFKVSAIIPLVTFVYIEGICILNQHNLFVGSPKVAYLLAIAGTVLLGGISFFILRKKEWFRKKNCYGMVVFGVAFLTIQLPLATTTGRSLFEHANASVLISDFLNFGKIPIVEHYGGHMLSTVLEGYLYGWINNDAYGAIYTPYYALTVPLIVVGFYLLLKQILDEEYAFWICLLIPFYDYWEYYGLGVYAILGFVWYIKKPSLKKSFLVWWICIACALYRLDVGLSFGGAVFVGIVFYCIMHKKAIKQWSFSFLLSAFICILTWGVLCLKAGVSPVERAVEFLLISLSNENWAYDGLGEAGLGLFSWSYIVVPFIILLCMVYIVFSKSFREKIGNGKYYILLTIGAAYLFNFSRGLVRHNLVEMATNVIIWCGYIFIAMFLSCFLKKKEVFLYALAVLMIVNNSLLSTAGFSKEGILEKSVDKLGETAIGWPVGSGDGAGETWQTLKENQNKVNRIMPNADLQQKIERLNKILNLVLNEDDTYLDFINESFLYSALERECPVYVSQSPGQLSGEFTQEKFMEQIESKREQVPLALMPTIWMRGLEIEIDGIANNTRYYKVAEYIYQNYRPLCRVDNIAIWCSKERYQEFYNLISGNIEQYNAEENMEDAYEFIDWGYDGYRYIENEKGENVMTYAEYLHSYPQELLPYLWANSDKKEAKSGELLGELKEKEKNVFVFSGSETIENSEKKNGNYLKFACRYNGEDKEGWESDEDEQCTVTLKLGKYENGEFEEKYQVKFTVKEGNYEYLIRVSSDYYWYSENINAVKIVSKKQLNNKEMCIIAGD